MFVCVFFAYLSRLHIAHLTRQIATGAVVTIGMQYTCDLDKSSSCSPDITVTRTDDPTSVCVRESEREKDIHIENRKKTERKRERK